ncbi:MAG TPA: 4'-phosphopantetheinyl transferase superfamily protein [Gemmatimonadaceae bacterium]|nr:4'-phosphopantetheinyl transferase superfamily protein [Gemmatimonadaceae bacterium]
MSGTRASWREGWRDAARPPLTEHAVHVWRVALDEDWRAEAYQPLLSDDERERADRCPSSAHRRRYVASHGALRVLLADYLGVAPEDIAYELGVHGKPTLAADLRSPARVEFNLSHSEDIALVALARARPVGVDVQHWSPGVEHLRLAERFFSARERDALRALSDSSDGIAAGFFAAWTRKEAYLKATGDGIARGLQHFDVSLSPGERARLLADRLDHDATTRWSMESFEPAPRYSAAVVVASPLHDVERFAL